MYHFEIFENFSLHKFLNIFGIFPTIYIYFSKYVYTNLHTTHACTHTHTHKHTNYVSDQLGEAVRVSGAKGRAPSSLYKVMMIHNNYVSYHNYYHLCPLKVSATYADGYRATALCPVVGPRAADKAIKTANSILARSVDKTT